MSGTGYADCKDIVANLVWLDAGDRKARVMLPTLT